MKILGQLLIWGSLAVGALAGANAYLASMDAPDAALVNLTLAAPAGKVDGPDGKPEPLAEKDRTVTAELLRQLRDAGVKTIRVKQFSLRRWRGKWYFLLSAAGLVLGAWITRAAAAPKPAEDDEAEQTDSPEKLLETIQDRIHQLRSQLAGISDRAIALDTIVQQVGQLQKVPMAAFADSRSELIAIGGLAGHAAVMDSYAAAERQINRAWSAAVDQAFDEATCCLDDASGLLEDTRRRLAVGIR